MGRHRMTQLRPKRRHDERGDLPIVTMMVAFLMLAVLLATATETTVASNSMTNTNRSTAGISASNLAGSAANALYSQIEANPGYITTQQWQSFPMLGQWAQFGPGGAIVACASNHDNGCFKMTLQVPSSQSNVGAPGPDGQQVQQAVNLTVQAVTDCNGMAGSCSDITTVQHISRKTFLDYLYFYGHSQIDPGLGVGGQQTDLTYPAYATGDVVNGPVHTNSTTLDSCGSPTFNSVVEVAGSTANWNLAYSDSGSTCSGSPKFTNGFVGNAPVLPLPTSDSQLASIAADGGTPWSGQSGYSFQGDITVQIVGNSLTITDPNGIVHPGVPFPQTGVVYATGNVSVQGNDTGAITIASGGDITVTGNITVPPTAQAPLAVVGLEAQGSVVIGDNGSGVTVDAAMLALTHSVHTAETYGVMPACSSTCPVLTIDGAMASQYRGLFGQFDPATANPVAGFTKNFTYDPRLYHLSPPWMTSQVAGQWMRSSAVSS